MATIADYLTELNNQKNALADNLNAMGVAADQSEKLNTLVPKVLECKTEQNVEAEFDTSTGAITSIHINIPNNITVVGDSSYYAFNPPISITIPENVTSIGVSAFASFSTLESITIPDSVTSIGESAFFGCYGLKNITIPNSITSLGRYIFNGCTKLESIIIPDSATYFGIRSFYNCKNLADIYYTGTEEQWNAIGKGSDWNDSMGSNVSGGTTIHYNYVPE